MIDEQRHFEVALYDLGVVKEIPISRELMKSKKISEFRIIWLAGMVFASKKNLKKLDAMLMRRGLSK